MQWWVFKGKYRVALVGATFYWVEIKKFNATDPYIGYNRAPGGEGNTGKWNGDSLSEEHIALLKFSNQNAEVKTAFDQWTYQVKDTNDWRTQSYFRKTISIEPCFLPLFRPVYYRLLF